MSVEPASGRARRRVPAGPYYVSGPNGSRKCPGHARGSLGSLRRHLGRLPRWRRDRRLPAVPAERRCTTSSTRGGRRSRTRTTTSRATTPHATGTATAACAELEADGVVAEVIFPNTIPPFFPQSSLVHQPPGATAGDLDLRWEGLRAHNRWLADFCAAAPGRRAGIAQIMLHDVDAAVAEIRWAAEAGLTRRRPAPRHARRARASAALRTRLRTDLGSVRGARHADQPPQRQRLARLRRLPRGEGDVPPRGHVVGAPHAVAPDLRRRDGAPPDAAVRVHRAGHRRGCPSCS